MVDLAALRAALNPIKQISNEEIRVRVAGVDLVLAALPPSDERIIQAWAREVLQDETGKEKDDLNQVEILEYLDRFKIGVLSYAVVQIGDIDLRSDPYVVVGYDEDGRPVQKEKHMVLREFFEKEASRSVILTLFKAYGDLVSRIEANVEKAIVYDPADLDSEIERLTERLNDLKERKRIQEQPARDTLSNQIHTIAQQAEMLQKAQQEAVKEAAPENRAANQPAAKQAPRQEARQPAIPKSAPPPSREPEPKPEPKSEPKSEAPAGDGIRDSFASPTEDAILEENRRILARRRKSAHQQGSATTPVRPGRVPPHRQAANTQNAVLDTGADQLRRAQKVGTMEGVEVYRMPPVDLGRRGGPRSNPDLNQAGIDREDDGGEVNKKFNPRR